MCASKHQCFINVESMPHLCLFNEQACFFDHNVNESSMFPMFSRLGLCKNTLHPIAEILYQDAFSRFSVFLQKNVTKNLTVDSEPSVSRQFRKLQD